SEKVTPSIYCVTLNRPQKRNALNIPLLNEIYHTIEALNKDPTVRVIIIKGAGPIFCAGLDLAEAADPSKSTNSAEMIANVFSIIYNSPHVTIAAVHGAAVAGGAGLMCACDLVLATEETKFGFPETQKGLVAAQVLTFLRRQLQERDIRELLILGELIDSKKASSIGLINRVVPKDELDHEVLNMAEKVLLGAPRAITLTKELIDDLHRSRFDEDLRRALSHHENARGSDEAKEGILAFLENRPPAWAEIIPKQVEDFEFWL
ncbi:MAG: enoyl-CoA hydratase-related protein, partial [Chlamydiota bacterium]